MSEQLQPPFDEVNRAQEACAALGFELAFTFLDAGARSPSLADDSHTGPTYVDGLNHAWSATSRSFVEGRSESSDERACVELGIALAGLDVPTARNVTRTYERRADRDRLRGVSDGLRDIRGSFETRLYQFLDSAGSRLAEPEKAKRVLSECFVLAACGLVSPTLDNLAAAARGLPSFDADVVSFLLELGMIEPDDTLGRLQSTADGRLHLIRRLPKASQSTFQ